MKKLTKNSLDAMAKLLPELDENDQRCIVGGTGSCTEVTGAAITGFTYSTDQMNFLMNVGGWMGGDVEGVGYVEGFTGMVRLTGTVPNDSFYKVADLVGTISTLIDEADVKNIPGLSRFAGAVTLIKDGADIIQNGGQMKTADYAKVVSDIAVVLLGTPALATSVTWGIVYEAGGKEFVKQGVDFTNRLEGTMGKDGNYSFYARPFGF